jgi:ectoine hydroxylase-related dioxygenase (phytanoyl-CoA dioxygenase family)
MLDINLNQIATDYQRDGYVAGIPILSPDEAMDHRQRLEDAEAKVGSLHYQSNVHTILTSPAEIVTDPRVLDIVEKMIGPNILLHNVTYITKEAHTESHVSWHQDLTFWGLSHDDQVTLWLALSPATEESGCMRMIPGSHMNGVQQHATTNDDNNVLLQGQTIQHVDESKARLAPLAVGEASFHHGWTMHASMPNNSDDRRIGLNVQYLATHVRQTKHDLDTAILVRGVDDFHHFKPNEFATSDLDPRALERQADLDRLYRKTAGTS